MRRAVVRTVFHAWWRLTRGLTLGVRGLVRDGDGAVLLVRHGYTPGWHLPGGGVERGETLRVALQRELREEAGIVVETPARLHGVFSNDSVFPGDHVAVFIVDQWRDGGDFRAGAEIVETGFHRLDALPEATTPGTRRRLREICQGAEITETW